MIPPEFAKDVQVGVHKHYRGPHYLVIGVSQESTNGRAEGMPCVVYISLEGRNVGRLHHRELGQFAETVMWPDGLPRPRFMFVGTPRRDAKDATPEPCGGCGVCIVCSRRGSEHVLLVEQPHEYASEGASWCRRCNAPAHKGG
jgi:hypothetical protein